MTVRSAAAWLAAYVALTVALLWPLALHLNSTVPHDLGDPLLSASLLWWNAHVVPLTSRWWDGFFFFPATGTIAFSDHRLGESLIASPLQWLGASPITAYNLTLIATFPLCAISAHALGFVLTGRHDAAAIAGLAFGFSPFRAAHIEHLELLAAFGMPAALACMHLYATTRRARWLIALTLALVVQALCASYYILFFSVLLLLWILWFVRPREWRVAAGIIAAAACMGVVVAPIAIGYARIHERFGLSRDLGQAIELSGDATSFITASPLSALWRGTSSLNGPERQLFPGIVIVVIVLIGGIIAIRSRRLHPDGSTRIAGALAILAGVFALVGLSTFVLHPWRVRIGPLAVGADVPYKPLSTAAALAVLAVAASARGRDAWRRRSPLAFYAAATVVLAICSMGPKPAFRGTQVLYQPPYAWLMRLPLFATEIRAPARFATLFTLTLAVAGALAFDRLTRSPSRRRVLAAAAIAGIVADSWIVGLAFPPLPGAWPPSVSHGFDAVVELPLNSGFQDSIALYRATDHGLAVVNGTSGYYPPHYVPLTIGLQAGDLTALDPIAAASKLLVAVDAAADLDHRWRTRLESEPRATPVPGVPGWSFFALAAPPSRPRCTGSTIMPAAASAGRSGIDLRPLVDDDPTTVWARPTQKAGETLTVDLGGATPVCGLGLSLGREVYAYPRGLNIAASLDEASWTTVFDGSTSGEAVAGALASPLDVSLDFSFAPMPARFIRLRLEATDATVPWLITGVAVRRPAR